MDLPLPETPGQEQHISLLSLDRRMTVMETRSNIDRERSTQFEEKMVQQLDQVSSQLADIREQRTLGNGTLRGIVLTLSFFGSGAGTGLLLIAKFLLGFGGS